jgi:hypothetical protein
MDECRCQVLDDFEMYFVVTSSESSKSMTFLQQLADFMMRWIQQNLRNW